jgi:hypothetical protein
MAQFERVREAVQGSLEPDYVRRREQAGWRIVGAEWEREAAPSGTIPSGEPETTARRQLDELVGSVPYGARVAEDCARLEENPSEMQFLLSMMELIIQDISISKVAEELNRKGFRTRQGSEWGPVAVFNMLPRLIELTPRIFATDEWVERRKKLTVVY